MKTEELPDHISHPTYEEELKKVCLIELFKEFERFPSSPDFSLLKRSFSLWLGSILNGIAMFSNIMLGLLFQESGLSFTSYLDFFDQLDQLSGLSILYFPGELLTSARVAKLNQADSLSITTITSPDRFNSLLKFAGFSFTSLNYPFCSMTSLFIGF